MLMVSPTLNNEPIDLERGGEIWPEREDTLSMLQKWKDQNPHLITPTEEPTQSLTKNNNQHAVFKLQNQRADFTRREVPSGSRLCNKQRRRNNPCRSKIKHIRLYAKPVQIHRDEKMQIRSPHQP